MAFWSLSDARHSQYVRYPIADPAHLRLAIGFTMLLLVSAVDYSRSNIGHALFWSARLNLRR
jgi:hypothetical protein